MNSEDDENVIDARSVLSVYIKSREEIAAWLLQSDRHGILGERTLNAVAAAVEAAPGRPAYGEDWHAFLVPDSTQATSWRDVNAPVDHIVRMCVAYEQART